MSALNVLFAVLLIGTVDAASRSRNLIHLNEENWQEVLRGEWMLEFHAPWCPACKDLAKAWNSFAEWSRDLNVKVAEIDVTENPGLSGRFLVTALPTIYHVKDGVFRVYAGPRDKEAFITFIEEKQWSLVEPLPSYKHPDSPQMAVVAVFFKLSMAVRDLHNHLVENIGVPSWASYALFAFVTLGLGCILGFFIVCIIDAVFPTGAAAAAAKNKKSKKNVGKDEATQKEATEKSSKTQESKPEPKKTK
ncbi:Thioredoxin [Aphelenchoides besseyi]|nr:Thioredoxin [Aphelenchoides besseyi]